MNTKLLGRVAPVKAISNSIDKLAIEKTAIEKAPIEKVARAKTAAAMDIAKTVGTHALAMVGTLALTNVLTSGGEKIRSMYDKSAYAKALDKAIALNPKLAQRSRADLDRYMELIIEASPSVAKNPLLVGNYLEYLLDHQGQLNYSAYTDLVDLESQIISNRSNSNAMVNMLHKSVIEGATKGVFSDLNGRTKDMAAKINFDNGVASTRR